MKTKFSKNMLEEHIESQNRIIKMMTESSLLYKELRIGLDKFISDPDACASSTLDERGHFDTPVLDATYKKGYRDAIRNIRKALGIGRYQLTQEDFNKFLDDVYEFTGEIHDKFTKQTP